MGFQEWAAPTFPDHKKGIFNLPKGRYIFKGPFKALLGGFYP